MTMRVRSIYLGFFLIAQALSAFGSEYEQLSNVRNTAVEALRQSHPLVQAPHIRNVEILAGNLDQRLRLSKCDNPLTAESDPNRRSSRLTVKVSCEGSRPWAIYVPVTIKADAVVATLSRDLKRGEIIEHDDISLLTRRISNSQQGYIHTIDTALGKTLKRGGRSGDLVLSGQLKEPIAVKRGDQVLVEANAGPIMVVANGIALASGHIGEQIRVRNADSERIISARIVNQGTVRVML
jgi:flagella basal body P-ring formation protein FlgA